MKAFVIKFSCNNLFSNKKYTSNLKMFELSIKGNFNSTKIDHAQSSERIVKVAVKN